MGESEKIVREESQLAEVRLLNKILSDPEASKIYKILKADFQVIYSHSQSLMGLTTICLTITGFSGPRIASSGDFSRYSIVLGLFFVILSVIILLMGPIYPKWMSSLKEFDLNKAFTIYFKRRDSRTRKYRLALISLVLGLSFYMASLLGYLLSL